MRRFRKWLIFGCLSLVPAFQLWAQEATPPSSPEPAVNSLFRDQFYLPPSERTHYKATSAEGLLIVEQVSPELNSKVAVVSDFAPHAIRTQVLKDLQSPDEAKQWIRDHKQALSFEGVPVVQISFPSPKGQALVQNAPHEPRAKRPRTDNQETRPCLAR